MTRLFRTGASWSAKDPAEHPLVTLAQYDPAEEPDGQGRRPSDRLVGCARRPIAEMIVDAVNAKPHLAGPIRQAFLDAADEASDATLLIRIKDAESVEALARTNATVERLERQIERLQAENEELRERNQEFVRGAQGSGWRSA